MLHLAIRAATLKADQHLIGWSSRPVREDRILRGWGRGRRPVASVDRADFARRVANRPSAMFGKCAQTVRIQALEPSDAAIDIRVDLNEIDRTAAR